MLTGSERQRQGSSEVEGGAASITTVRDRIWKERQKPQGHLRVLVAAAGGPLLWDTHTHLDCGDESVLSFNSSSETSVSRISGLDLFPYLRHREERVWSGLSPKGSSGNHPSWFINI